MLVSALYRTGRLKEAARTLKKGVKSAGPEGDPWGWLFLAMVNQRLGHAGEARSFLDKATAWIDRTIKAANTSQGDGLVFYYRLELKLLRAEAEAALRAKRS